MLDTKFLQSLNPIDLPFVPIEEKRSLPSSSGIYFLIDGEDEILYVGQTKNFLLRWLTHPKLQLQSLHPNLRIAWLECSDVSLLKTIEAILIEQLDPIYNRDKSPTPSLKCFTPTNSAEAFLRDLILILQLPPLTTPILLSFLDRMDGGNWLTFSNNLKHTMALSLSLSSETIERSLSRMVDADIATRDGACNYQFNHNYFGLGQWRDVVSSQIQWQLVVTYSGKTGERISIKGQKSEP